MVAKCCVPGCKHNSYNNSPIVISFHRFPSGKNLDLREKWIENASLSPSEVTDSSRVCSAHFKKEDFKTPSDNATHPMALLRSGAVPSIFAPLLNEIKSSPSNANFDELPVGRKKNVKKMGKKYFSNSVHSDTHLIDDKQVANFDLASEKLFNELLTAKNEALKNLQNKLTKKVLTFDNIKNDSDLIEFYTGFVNDAAYSAFLRHFNTRAERNLPTIANGDGVLSTEDSFFLTLIRLKLGFPAVELARIFGISVESVDRYFTAWINFLSHELRNLLPNLSFEGLTQWKFPVKIITESTLMVDCIENHTSSACGRFNYTGKTLVAVTSEGSVCFVSDVEEESASFWTIVSKSDFLNFLRAGQVLITDKGSEIKDLLPAGVIIDISAPNLNDIIQKVKSNRILDGCLPFSLEIWKKSIAICAMLINFKRGDKAPDKCDNTELELPVNNG